MPLDFQIEGRSGKDVLKIEELSAIIGDKVLFDGANLATLDFSQFWMTDVSCLWFVFMAGFFGNPGCVCSLLLPGYRLPFLLQ